MDVPFYSKKSFLAGRLFKVSSDFRNPPADKEKKSTELGLWCPQRPDKKTQLSEAEDRQHATKEHTQHEQGDGG